jgi:O-antigen/teichoic acid export membrane protein
MTMMNSISDNTADGANRATFRLASKTDYALTYVTYGLISVLGILAFRFAHRNFAEIGFAEYALTRRGIAFLLPLLSLGTTVAIAKFVAADVSERSANSSIHILIGGLIVTLVSMAIYALAIMCFPSQVACLCLGTNDRASLVISLLPMIGGLVLVNCCSAYCRGRLYFVASNALQLASIGVIPCFALLFTNDVDHFLIWAGAAICVLGIGTCAVLYLKAGFGERECHWSATRSLLKYGLPRVPGDLAFYGLFVVPAVVVAHRSGVQSAGEVAYAFTWLTILSQLVAPMNVLILPEAAYLIRAGQIQTLRKRLYKLLPAFIVITSLMSAVLACGARQLIELHLGTCSPSLLHDVRLLIWTAVPLNFFICVRSVIDAGESRAVSPAFCIVALFTFWIALPAASGHRDAATAVIAAFVISVCTLAALSGVATWLVLRNPAPLDELNAAST